MMPGTEGVLRHIWISSLGQPAPTTSTQDAYAYAQYQQHAKRDSATDQGLLGMYSTTYSTTQQVEADLHKGRQLPSSFLGPL